MLNGFPKFVTLTALTTPVHRRDESKNGRHRPFRDILHNLGEAVESLSIATKALSREGSDGQTIVIEDRGLSFAH